MFVLIADIMTEINNMESIGDTKSKHSTIDTLSVQHAFTTFVLEYLKENGYNFKYINNWKTAWN
jgi:hypothetical protein